MTAIDLTDLEKHYGARPILAGVSFTVEEGDKIGIIGANGSGKSTLLRILAGLEEADGGKVTRKRGLRTAFLPQQPQLDPALSIRRTLEDALSEARAKAQRFQELAAALQTAGSETQERLMTEQQEVQHWLDLHQGWNLDRQVETICTRFGILDPELLVGTLSGGWLKRVAMAAVLLGQPDLLLLDEPTNHLDTETIAWLEESLREFPGAVMLVTHDRYFLDRVVGRMFELEQGQLTAYKGGYSAYLEQKQERLLAEGRSQSRLMNLLRREEAWLRRGAKARTTKQKARIDRVGDLQAQKNTVDRREVKINFEPEQRLGGTILETRKLQVAIADRVLINDLDLILRKGERLGILGPNGSGKSTLLRTLLGEVPVAAGEVVIGKNTRIGYLDQNRSGLDDQQFVFEALGEGDWVTLPGGDKRHKIGYLEDFLFSPSEQRKRIATLSGGERARLLLARMMLQGANLLILDEPTNDLDIPTMQVLEDAFASFPGCLLVVTHDRFFLDRIATGILHFSGNQQVSYSVGNYEDFLHLHTLQLQKERLEAKAEATVKTVEAPVANRKRSGLSYRERQELETLEEQIMIAEERQGELQQLLCDPAQLAGDHERLAAVTREFTELEARITTLFERWEELEGKRGDA